MNKQSLRQQLYASIQRNLHQLGDDIARLEIHHNQVLGSQLVPGLDVDATEEEDGVSVRVQVKAGQRIQNPVHMCFGMVPETGRQVIKLQVDVEAEASVDILAHCTFPNAVEVEHLMDAQINVHENAHYSYFERHVHGREGGVKVVPNASVNVEKGGVFQTEFELLEGRVGLMDIDYEAWCGAESVLEMLARISGRGDDRVRINEKGHLQGDSARGALTSHVALRDQAEGKIENTLTADAAYARGHVDCKEIVQNEARASAVPIVDVRHPEAHITHEAAIGSVDSKQLETLMARGLDEDEATELIIQGLLSRPESEA